MGTLRAPLTPRTVHLCVDMQRILASGGLWAAPWMERVLPIVTEVAGGLPDRSVFTRIITPERPETLPGCGSIGAGAKPRARVLDPAWLELLDPLRRLIPPAKVIHKTRHSAFADSALLAHRFRKRGLRAGDRARSRLLAAMFGGLFLIIVALIAVAS